MGKGGNGHTTLTIGSNNRAFKLSKTVVQMKRQIKTQTKNKEF